MNSKAWHQLPGLADGWESANKQWRVIVPERRKSGSYCKPVRFDLYNGTTLVGSYPTKKKAQAAAISDLPD